MCRIWVLSCEYKLTKPSDDEDEAAELMRELEKIKKERLEQKEKEVRPLSVFLWFWLTCNRSANGQQRKRSSVRLILLAVTLCSTRKTST